MSEKSIFSKIDVDLMQCEVDKLPNGSIVEIVWTGGNGPHRYTVEVSFDGFRTLRECGQWPDFVGEKSPYTTVRLIRRGN